MLSWLLTAMSRTRLSHRAWKYAPLVLPEAVGGTEPYTYMLEPSLPSGLVFDATARTISGTPTVAASKALYTYTVRDANVSTDSLFFGIEVVARVSFSDVIADQSFPRAQPITPLVLPEATGGSPPIEYTLTPALPDGLVFDSMSRTMTGTPTMVTGGATPYTYRATGSNGSVDNVIFGIEVYSPVSAERESLPQAFAMHGSYPNPFREATSIVFDPAMARPREDGGTRHHGSACDKRAWYRDGRRMGARH